MDSNWITLEWDSPMKDGGSRVIGYSLEYREYDSHAGWAPASAFNIKENKFTLEGLRDKGTYEFRGKPKPKFEKNLKFSNHRF